jgi:hypothetical protein
MARKGRVLFRVDTNVRKAAAHSTEFPALFLPSQAVAVSIHGCTTPLPAHASSLQLSSFLILTVLNLEQKKLILKTVKEHFIAKARIMKSIIWAGVFLALLGILGLAVPVFTTSQTKDVAKLGDIKIQNTEQSTHVVPQPLSFGVLILGVVLIGAGLYHKR